MTSEFVRKIHLQTAKQMLQKGACFEMLAEHLHQVGFNEIEIAACLTEFGNIVPKSPDEEFV